MKLTNSHPPVRSACAGRSRSWESFEAVNVHPPARSTGAPAFLEINPAGKLPVLVDGDAVLTESIAIVLYLGEKYPERGLLPTGRGQRAEVDRWILFAATELEQPLWRITVTRSLSGTRRLPAMISRGATSARWPQYWNSICAAAIRRGRARQRRRLRDGLHARLGE